MGRINIGDFHVFHTTKARVGVHDLDIIRLCPFWKPLSHSDEVEYLSVFICKFDCVISGKGSVSHDAWQSSYVTWKMYNIFAFALSGNNDGWSSRFELNHKHHSNVSKTKHVTPVQFVGGILLDSRVDGTNVRICVWNLLGSSWLKMTRIYFSGYLPIVIELCYVCHRYPRVQWPIGDGSC